MLPAPFQQEGAILPVLIPPHFERFYRAALRRVVGSRVRSVKLRDAYLAWAGDHSAPSMSFIELRQSLEALGHRRVQSDGVHYADIILASDAPGLADMLPVMPGGFIGSPRAAEKDEVIAKVDAVLASLLDLRRTLVAKVEREAPAEAAQRILDLFER